MVKKILIVLLLALSFGSIVLPGGSVQAASRDLGSENRQFVETFWNELFNQHNVNVIDNKVDDIYIQHSPSVADGKVAFKNAMTNYLKEFPESTAEIKRIVSEGGYVFIHNHIKLNPQDRGQAAVDIFRVENGKIVEHWDIIQDVPEQSENNNTMF